VDQQSRRQFLGKALLAGAGATLVEPFAPTRSADARVGVGRVKDPAAGYDPNFVAGKIVDTAGSGSFVVADPDGDLQFLRVADPSAVWKEGLQGALSLELGDCLYARGERQASGRLDASAVWVDIRNFQAEVVRNGNTDLTMQLPNGQGGASMAAHVEPTTKVEYPGRGFIPGDISHLSEGDILQVVGYGDPVAGHFVATRVFVLSSPNFPPPTHGPDDSVHVTGPPTGPDNLCPHTYAGITSWFCCGGILACGATCTGPNCGNPCGGMAGRCGGNCPTCRTDYQHMAWPQLLFCCGCGNCISDCGGTNCNCSTSCCSGLPEYQCGKGVNIYALCTNKSTIVTVTDAGPCVYCVSPFGCQGYIRVKFDLTACAFSAIAPIDYGRTDIQATIYLGC
jgi:hypothetical protein